MEPELKQQAPKLIVGDAQVVDQNSNAADQAFSDNEKDNLPDLIPQEQESAKQIEKLSPAENTDKAKTDSPSDAKAGSPEQTKTAPPGQAKATSSAEEVPFVISVVDIIAIVYVVVSVVLVSLLPTLEEVFPVSLGKGFTNMVYALVPFCNLWFYSYWLSDVVSRLHQIKKAEGFWPQFDRVACVHPVLLMFFFMLPSFMSRGFGDRSNSVETAVLTGVLIVVVGLPPMLRWLYLSSTLFYKCANLVPDQKKKKETQILGGLAAASLLGFMLSALGVGVQILAVSCSGLFFVLLRNAMIQAAPAGQLAALNQSKIPASSSNDVVLPYNHFVEVQKWFKQRFALRSPWKLGVLLLILIAAVACRLHLTLINFINDNVVSFAAHIPGAITPGSQSARDPLSLNTLANSGLVFTFAASMLAIATAAIWAFIRAPKKLAAGPDGLRLRFAPVSGRDDQFVPWYGVEHIKVVRPKGKTSAASDRIVFERYLLPPFSIKLAAIASADDRERLLAAIDRFAPQISREAAIEETLRKPMEHNYTELWLQALAAPPKREKLKPLIEGAELDGQRYQVERQLGSGGQGFAYLARDARKNKMIVLKEFVLPVFVDINARRQSLENFEKEAKLMTRLDHPQVVKLEDFFVEDHRAYLVLEHIDGENLREIVLRDGPMSEERIKKLGEQMCSILTYLHKLSPPLVHRDFTPDNLILHKDGTLKLIDFNVAQQVEYATTGTVVGKQSYLPPEQFRGQAVPSSDLYALGATLYFLASGKDPTPISVARPIKDGLALSAELDHLISSLTQMEPIARPSSASEVATVLKGEKDEESSN